MTEIQEGDLVTHLSFDHNDLFEVLAVRQNNAWLHRVTTPRSDGWIAEVKDLVKYVKPFAIGDKVRVPYLASEYTVIAINGDALWLTRERHRPVYLSVDKKDCKHA